MDEFSVEKDTPSRDEARHELDDAVADLVLRFKPATLANNALDDAKLAASDAAGFLSGAGLPETSPRRRRNAIAILAGSGGALALVAIKLLGRKRR
ncbi:hypothetical protein GCM10010401_13570 [Rarobacter faecitabidus]|uniref:Gram-positive cocci surface proteins LPxTG domain-containing protein n=1 Tax=Rarobacter faecitabidus TaxID=13243 RepID=A0A542ZE21_RARFA|nr:DUF3618 domain-containing protein [Rarobacter faecitabidus]TQL58595.1 hypothetical protein FB461_2013 [Rarobacter faecitabidus]